MRYVYHDGGRAAAGFKGITGDCVTRAIAIATGLPYQEVYDELNMLAEKHERPRGNNRRSSARTGVKRSTYHRFLVNRGWQWVPTMQIGSGCTVHLRDGELPKDKGPLIVRVSRHVTAVIDGTIYDNHNPSRNEWRCVYGYYHHPYS